MRRLAPLLLALALSGAPARPQTPSAPEKPVQLPAYAVNERGFGKWGVALRFRTNPINLLFKSGPPAAPYTVEVIQLDSPGHRAGLRVGDQVEGIEGRHYRDVSLGEMRELFYETESGRSLTLRVRDPFSGAEREVVLRPDLSRRWRDRRPRRHVYWDVVVQLAPREAVRTRSTRDDDSARGATLRWAGAELHLAPRPGGGVDAWLKDAPPTRLPAGTVVELHDDGTYAVQAPAS